MKSIKLIFIAVLAGFAMMTLGGCATVEGFGKDVQKLGGSIEKSAK